MNDNFFAMNPDPKDKEPNKSYKKEGDEFSENNRENVFTTSKLEVAKPKHPASQGVNSISPFSSVEEMKDHSFQFNKKKKNMEKKSQIKIGYEEEGSHSKAAPPTLL